MKYYKNPKVEFISTSPGSIFDLRYLMGRNKHKWYMCYENGIVERSYPPCDLVFSKNVDKQAWVISTWPKGWKKGKISN